MAKKEKKLISINLDNENREYDANQFSEATNQKIAQMQFCDQSILTILSEVLRLVRLGRAVDANELKTLLPKEYTVKKDENAVESESKNDKGDISSE